MEMNIGNVINSVTEGVGALGQGVKSTIEGDTGNAAEAFARVGLEVGGIAATALTGPGAEIVAEGLEGVLDNAVLEQPTGDVPGPGGHGANWSIPNLLSGAVGGTLEGAKGAGGAAFGKAGGAGSGGSIGKILGAVSGQGGAGGAEGAIGQLLGQLDGAGSADQGMSAGAIGTGSAGGKMSAFGMAAELISNLGQSEGQVASNIRNASL